MKHITHTITRSVRTLRESKLILTPIHQGSEVVLGSEGPNDHWIDRPRADINGVMGAAYNQ